MDIERVKRLRHTLSLHFVLLACLTAMLVASGSGTFFLPLLVFVVSVAGYLLVDKLEWFELGRIGSYFGMTLATCIAVASYIYSVFVIQSETGQLAAVAGLLIYPECVLFLQRKNLRVYEQLAIFLLLEMIVAALINDNLLFGILLTPIMLLWVSSLFLFSRYATLAAIDPSIDDPVPLLVEIIYKRFVKPMFGNASKQSIVTSIFCPAADVQASRPVRRALQTLPIGMGAIFFAAIFFYLLPRTSTGVLRTSVGMEPRTGLPSELRMGVFGRLLQDTTPVMRVSFSTLNHKPYTLTEPPYLRARVYDQYVLRTRGVGTYWWQSSAERPYYPKLEPLKPNEGFAALGQDHVIAEIDIRREFARTLYTLPPAFASRRRQVANLLYDDYKMVLGSFDADATTLGKSLIYEIGSSGFANQQQLRILPAYLPRTYEKQIREMLVKPVIRFEAAEPYRQEILRDAECAETDLYQVAKAFENRFIYSGDFSYSLDLRPPADPALDPIEDFIVNQRQGHCQYFAAAMVAMLRKSGIPSRIVGGYRPIEFNRFGYFVVHQSDAHTWVEGLFTREQLLGTELERWLTNDPQQEYWVRFDSTPDSEGGTPEIVEQRGQAMDYAQKLWKDYVVDGQKLSGENSIYAPVSEDGENAYKNMIDRFKQFIAALQSGRLLEERGRIEIAWPIAFIVFGLGGFGIAAWRLAIILPRWAPNLAKRLGLARRGPQQVKEVFFARCLELLHRQGLQRAESQTPLEFTAAAATSLGSDSQPTPTIAEPLRMLTSLYYRLRFSSQSSLSPDETQAIDNALKSLEQASQSRLKT
ncbi:MAG: DUF3488 and transglutaminase-like domain-containing protein [Pirellulaceae bacterium]